MRARTDSGTHRKASLNPWLVFGAAALVALLVYLPTLTYEFVWDDGVLIVQNPALSRTNPVELFTGGFWYNPETAPVEGDMAYYRPLAGLSFYVDRKIWGLRPAGYHLTNVVMNTAVVFLACLFLWELFGSTWLAGLGGLLVGIHPAMNCVVTFIANRTYLLALLFLLAGGYALLRGQRRRRAVWPVLFGCSLLLSSLALEAALAFAAIAAAWLVMNRARYQKLRVWSAAAASPAAVYLLLRFGIARVPLASSAFRWLVAEPLRVVNTFGQQLQLLFFPFNQKVIYVVSEPFTRFSAYTVLGLVFLGLPLYALIRLGRRVTGSRDADGVNSNLTPSGPARPGAKTLRLGWFGYTWMVLFLLPFAHLVFLGPAGRMLYLAAPGALILLIALSRATLHKRLATRIVFGVVLLYTAALAVQTVRRNSIWQSELSLSQAMVQEAPRSAGARLNRGAALAAAGRRQEAVAEFRAALELNPDYAEPHDHLAFALIDLGDLPAAIRELREVVRLRPESPEARINLAVTLRRDGQLDSAIAESREALRLDPKSELALNNLGFAYLTRGDYRPAITALKAALRLNPGFAGARANLAEAYRSAGMPDSAALIESGD